MLWFFALAALASPDVYGTGAGTANGVVSTSVTYSPASAVSGSAGVGAVQVTVADASAFSAGDLVLIHQTAGAIVASNGTNPAPPMDLVALGVGHWELARVVGVVGNTLDLDGPMQSAYGPGGQVVLVEEFADLDVTGTITAAPWDGSSGGILAIAVDGTLTNDGLIHMNQAGFRGAPVDTSGSWTPGCNAVEHVNSGWNGDGVGGLSGNGYGNRANGAGGGSCGNGGGGGGGNAGNGGRGGRTWEGDGGRDVGGIGGASAQPDVGQRFILGGGGGGGEANNSPTDTYGGDGGGMIFIRARQIDGSGSFEANGESGALVSADDGVGGGGAGGTIALFTAGSISCGSVSAVGGNGGNLFEGIYSEHGPGGGGGGGLVHLGGTATCPASVAGGVNGVYENVDPWGAIPGDPGVVDQAPATFVDADGDGALSGPGGGGPDCDDSDPTVGPGTVELCDGLDQDCNGLVDDGLAQSPFHPDGDGDGFGDGLLPVDACAAPPGHVADGTDCDDGDPAVHPAALEVCSGQDEDCDGLVDDDDPSLDPSAGGVWYDDVDGDSYGGAAVTACVQPPGTVDNDLDCDDNNDAIRPGVVEHCDGVDENCDGQIDENAVDALPFYNDGDGDGFGDAKGDVVYACTAPPGMAGDGLDCNDADDTVFPGATEFCNGEDNDCDGVLDNGAVDQDWYLDADGDGYGDDTQVTVDCAPPTPDHVPVAGDCDDSDPLVHPGAPEVPDNGVDEDCDGEDLVGTGTGTGTGTGESNRDWTPGEGKPAGAAGPVGCGCASSPSPVGPWPWLLLAPLGVVRRFRRRGSRGLDQSFAAQRRESP